MPSVFHECVKRLEAFLPYIFVCLFNNHSLTSTNSLFMFDPFSPFANKLSREDFKAKGAPCIKD